MHELEELIAQRRSVARPRPARKPRRKRA